MCFDSAKTVNLSAMSCLDAEMQASEVRDSNSSFHDGTETHLPTASIRSFSHTTQLMKLPTCIYRKGSLYGYFATKFKALRFGTDKTAVSRARETVYK